MATSVSTRNWALQMPAGSLQQWVFTFTDLDAGGHLVPFPITGDDWEYVVRTTAGALVFSVNTVATVTGAIVVTATASLSQLLLQVYPPATAGLAPQTYSHALWQNPGTPEQALAVLSGPLIIDPAAQP